MTTQLDDKIGFNAFGDQWQDHVRLVLDTIAMRPTQGIPTFMLHDMQWSHLETFSGNPPGSYEKEPVRNYERICKMKTREGDDLFIIAGVSVTTTLPLGKSADVRRQIDWLVEKGPKVGLLLGCSSSIVPGVPLENMKTLIEGFAHYRQHGRG